RNAFSIAPTISLGSRYLRMAPVARPAGSPARLIAGRLSLHALSTGLFRILCRSDQREALRFIQDPDFTCARVSMPRDAHEYRFKSSFSSPRWDDREPASAITGRAQDLHRIVGIGHGIGNHDMADCQGQIVPRDRTLHTGQCRSALR